jgi:hypothetical protein
MSHELRTPLNAIIGFSDVMRSRLFGQMHARYEEYAGLIHESGQHLLSLITDILDLSKIEAGKFVLDPRPVDMGETVASCLEMTRRRAEETGITLSADVPDDLPMLVADPRSVKQILLNLLSNAVKFTPAGGHVSLSAKALDGRLRLSVRDTGIGIPGKTLARIGAAFEQANNDPMLAREGTGLGPGIGQVPGGAARRHGADRQPGGFRHHGVGRTSPGLWPASRRLTPLPARFFTPIRSAPLRSRKWPESRSRSARWRTAFRPPAARRSASSLPSPCRYSRGSAADWP